MKCSLFHEKNLQSTEWVTIRYMILFIWIGYSTMEARAALDWSMASAPDTNQPAPNILLITLDNIGYGDLRPFNASTKIRTPNIDRMAKQGARLTNFYTASPTCTVSRASLLTGRIPQRHQLVDQLQGIAGNYGIGLRQSEILLPQILNSSGPNYSCGAFGKWNIGFAPGSRPTERGFDEFLGIASGNADHFSHVYAGKHDLHHNTESINRHGIYSTDLFADAAIEFIRSQTETQRSWFVYLPFDAPHHPGERNVGPDEPNIWKAPDYALAAYGLAPDERDSSKRFNAVVTAIDMAIGRLLEAIDSLGISENTFVFLYSDNGAFYPYLNIQSNAPFKGAGVTLWEGGIRVPALVRWRGKIRANSVIDTRLWSLDLFPTIAKIAGATLPQDRFIDGKNMLPNLVSPGLASPHATLWFQYRDFSALHWDDWKIIREVKEAPWQLYNLSEDQGEKINLASARMEVVQKLSAAFAQQEAEIENYSIIEKQFQK